MAVHCNGSYDLRLLAAGKSRSSEKPDGAFCPLAIPLPTDECRKDADETTDLERSGRTKVLKNRTSREIMADQSLSDQRADDDAARGI